MFSVVLLLLDQSAVSNHFRVNWFLFMHRTQYQVYVDLVYKGNLLDKLRHI
jgi:hypothetical protein